MKELNANPPVRIVKKKSHHGGHHGGAWKVAYADFVTAMMALFIVLWIVGQSKEVKEYVAYYFRDPGAFSQTTSGTGVLSGGSLSAPRPAEKEITRETEIQKLQALGDSIMTMIASNPAAALLKDQVEIQIVPEGLRIEMLESAQSVFFDIGTSTLKPEARTLIETIGSEISTLPNKVIVEGHTDSRKYSTSTGYTNFELSADRANSARRALVAAGLEPHQITEVRGYADSKLRKRDNPYDASNRRISIILQYQSE